MPSISLPWTYGSTSWLVEWIRRDAWCLPRLLHNISRQQDAASPRHSVRARGWTSSSQMRWWYCMLLFSMWHDLVSLLHSEPWNVFTFRFVFLFVAQWLLHVFRCVCVYGKKYVCFFTCIDYYIIVKLYCTDTDGWHFGWYSLTEVFLNWKFIVLRSDRSDIWLTHNHCDLGHAMQKLGDIPFICL